MIMVTLLFGRVDQLGVVQPRISLMLLCMRDIQRFLYSHVYHGRRAPVITVLQIFLGDIAV